MADSRYTSSGSFRVRPHRPMRSAVLMLALLVGLGVGAWQLYELGMRHGGFHANRARATEAHLRIEVDELRDRITKMANRNTLLERAERIERQSREDLRGVIEQREAHLAQLEEELSFYRNLVSPSDMQPGLHVRRFSVAAVAGEARDYRYELVLTQLHGNDTYASGRVDLALHGRRGRQEVRLAADELLADEGARTEFRFKYLQTLTGRIRVPAGFVPGRIELRLVPEGERLDTLEESYSWSSLLSGGS